MQRHEKSRKAMIDAMHRELETTFKKEYDAGKVYLMAALQQHCGSYRRLDLTDPGKLSGNGCDV